MAGILKYWRESASLLLASRQVAVKTPKKQSFNKLFSRKEKIEPEEKELLRFLFVKRSTGSSFMPNNYVFPGGVVDDTDFSKDWLNLIKFNTGAELLNLFTHGHLGAPIFSRNRDSEFSSVPSEIALRITAIRETFEESGILLARKNEDLLQLGTHKLGEPLKGTVLELSDKEQWSWRQKIIEEPLNFMKMCSELEAVPDIWSLYEWSNWLTPTFRKGHRFDTAFFLSCIDEGPKVADNTHETTEIGWESPSNMLEAYSNGALVLAPPQIYEMSRLVRFASIEDLLSLTCSRSKHRVQCWMPVVMACKDGLVFLLPGDELYPEEPDYTGEKSDVIETDDTFEELCLKHPLQHRAVLDYKSKHMSFACTLKYIDGHILPADMTRIGSRFSTDVQPESR